MVKEEGGIGYWRGRRRGGGELGGGRSRFGGCGLGLWWMGAALPLGLLVLVIVSSLVIVVLMLVFLSCCPS